MKNMKYNMAAKSDPPSIQSNITIYQFSPVEQAKSKSIELEKVLKFFSELSYYPFS